MELDLDKAIYLLKQQELVAFPTETVYGLGAVLEDKALQKLFEVKGRALSKPFTVQIPEVGGVHQLADDIPEIFWELAEAFWPGPLTLILKRKESLSSFVTGGKDSVGLRIPSHPIARYLLEGVDQPLAVPSANLSGKKSPIQVSDFYEDLHDKIGAIIDGGMTDEKCVSTVVSLENPNQPLLLREGVISWKVLSGFF